MRSIIEISLHRHTGDGLGGDDAHHLTAWASIILCGDVAVNVARPRKPVGTTRAASAAITLRSVSSTPCLVNEA